MIRFLLRPGLAAILALAAATSVGRAAPATAPRMVLELFTSQGCSSCPPADKLMGEMAREPGKVVLSFPVDYWDYLGWHDTLAKPAFSARQRSYCKARGDRQVYTPQVIIDGVTHAVGSERAAIEQAAAGPEAQASLKVPVTLSGGPETVTVSVGAAGDGPARGALWLFPVRRSHTVTIGHGENSGRSLTYTNVVRGIIRIGDWNGTAQRYTIPAATLRTGGADSYVVLLQAGTDGKPGMILGAAENLAAGL